MMKTATPIGILETYFERRLERAALKFFDDVVDDTWIDFAKQYLATMQQNFAREFLYSSTPDHQLRFYFEPRMCALWDRTVISRYDPTPLLGVDAHPPDQDTTTRDVVSTMLDPLKKHLLIGNSVYVRDSFYYCFDLVADSTDRLRWRENPNSADQVRRSIRYLKNWLPILIELRDFIESGSLVFMPYYATPSFPYDAGAPELKRHLQRLRMHPASEIEPAPLPQPLARSTTASHFVNENETLTAWLNGRLLGLDPVFPDRAMSDWASRLYFDDGEETADICSDLISLQLLPFGQEKSIHIDDLWEIRTNEEVFSAVQRIVLDCKAYMQKEIGPNSTKKAVTDACKTFLADHLDRFERTSKLRFLKYADESKAVNIGLSIAIGAALLPASLTVAAISVVVSPFITVDMARSIQDRLSPTRRAYAHLQALL